MTIKSVLFLLLTLGVAGSALAAVYVDFTAARLDISGTPAIGDRGTKLSDDLPSSAFTFAVGYELTPRVALEARFTSIGDTRVSKLSPSSSVFPPPGGVDLPVLTYYLYQQETRLYTLAVPLRVFERSGFSATVTPLAHLERSDFTFTNTGVNTLLLPGPLPVIFRDTRSSVRFGAEVKLAYRFNEHVGAHVSYSYSALEAYHAQLLGAGLEFRF